MSGRHLAIGLAVAAAIAGGALAYAASNAPVVDEPPGSNVTVTFPDSRKVEVETFKVDAKHGLSNAQCGVIIGSQRIETLGSGDTETYTCDKFVEAGPLPPAESTARIGLIYDASSANASFRTAVILVQDGESWKVDAESLGEFDDSEASKSIEALAEAVGQ